MADTQSNPFPVGALAPSFKLLNPLTGAKQSLEECKGEHATVIVFMCNHCPFVIHINKMMVAVANKYIKKGVTFIAISSNDVKNYPQDSPKLMAELAQNEQFPFPYLYDESQEVAKAYNAACTPDFYVFNNRLKATYHGQFDDSRPRNGRPVTGHDVQYALDRILSHGAPPENQKPSIGCNIKWKQELT
ncbi:thioredoxin family protein [Bizionia saleffrena]|uniref:Thioredoxin family protein n=1 Tax=Bizionia saleffrena TaxID=291189 RepID=A0A8H2LEZ2_9FLAO|nr:thioredoxin family protein [Bizionia saleffrena]TYB74398.1 thioredoxin family protein [Bizionia saleffrena]